MTGNGSRLTWSTCFSSFRGSRNAYASGLGLGADGNADATSTLNSSPTLVEVGAGAAVTGRYVLLSATVSKLQAISHAEGYGAGHSPPSGRPLVSVREGRVVSVEQGMRGFVFNADLVSVIRFLDIGTRVAQDVR